MLNTQTPLTRTISSKVCDNDKNQVMVQGFVHKIRKMGSLAFVVVRDRGGLVQVVLDQKDEISKLDGLYAGTILQVEGTAKLEPRAPNGAEIIDCKLTVIVPVTHVPPVELDKKFEHKSETLETLFENKVVMVRMPQEIAIYKVQAGVKQAVREYLMSQEFIEFNSPKLLTGSTEGGAEVFKLDYFGQEATLAQSAQFYKQIMVGAFERAFEINPTYRAELSATTRHMTEFMHIDAEMGFITLRDLMDLLSGLTNYVVTRVWETHRKELELLGAKPVQLTAKLPEYSIDQIHELYTKATGESTLGEKDLRPDEERFICEYVAKKDGSEALFVTGWPYETAKFYHKKNEADPKTFDRIDMLLRGVEVATGSMREHRYDILVEQLKTMAGGNPESVGFKYYLQAFKHGMPPHGGFGMGLERMVQKIIGLGNVKEASLFPRDINRLAP